MSEANISIGRNSVTEALKAGRSITKLYVAAGNESQPLQRIRDLAGRKEILVEDVPLKVLNHLAPGNRHQGVIAFAKPVEYADLTDVLIAADEKGTVPFLVLLDGIEDVHNMGAIIRTAASKRSCSKQAYPYLKQYSSASSAGSLPASTPAYCSVAAA